MVTRSEAIGRFLAAVAPAELANLYHLGMECQVNVAQDAGDKVEGEYMGRRWAGWSDGITTWKSFRIPHKANSDPEYTDRAMKFDLAEHAEGIGMTGWDWQRRVSRWVAFDFDAIVGHSERHQAKLTYAELERVRKEAEQIEWVTVRRSTGGKGIHLYVFLEDYPTQNHNEHAALARAILGKMSALCGFDFASQVDICGGNMWVWHRKARGKSDALALLKQGTQMPAAEVPVNWRDHLRVVKRTGRKILNQHIPNPDSFEDLAGQNVKIPLDEEHKALINYLKDNKCLWWWDQDHWSLTTHTSHLREAHEALGARGVFETMSQGRESGNDHNCFLFPMRRGAWVVRRYSPGCSEAPTWDQDGSGWTRCYFNRDADIATAARSGGGVEDPSGGFVFRHAKDAIETAKVLGVTLEVGESQKLRPTKLKQHKDGRLVVEVDADAADDGGQMAGWLNKKGKWIRIYGMSSATPDEPEIGNYDDVVRHLVTDTGEDYGWVIKSDDLWRVEPLTHIKAALSSLGFSAKEVIGITGSSVFKPWRLVNKPFEDEYPGDREWNRNAAQFRFAPNRDKDVFDHPTWSRILRHCGSSLNEAVTEDSWCQANGITTGADFLKCWIASLVQRPNQPLPYLFFWGPQNNGKSSFHEMLDLLFTSGYKRADVALVSQSNFNAELEGAILCVVEETDLRVNKQAYNRIKDYVTSLKILIHRKNQTPYHVPNTTHWVQCSNDSRACPVMFGDTRIVMAYVPELDPLDMIPKGELMIELEKEAPDFIASLLAVELPPAPGRLGLPVLETADKASVAEANMTPIQTFLRHTCIKSLGNYIELSDLFVAYEQWAEANGEMHISKIKFGREIAEVYPKGRNRTTNQVSFGNMTWKANPEPTCGYELVLRGEMLERVAQNRS